MKLPSGIIVSVVFAALILTFQDCEKKSLPSVKTLPISVVTQVMAISGGEVTNNGGAKVISRGICWNTSQEPTTTCDKTSDGSGNGAFSSNISGLTAGTIYYIRAYASNSEGTAYGQQLSFTTLQDTSAKIPVADFIFSKSRVKIGENIQFTDKSKNSPTKWKWSFGDDSTSTLQNPVHKYTSSGLFTVSLTASNYAGSDTKSIINCITVDPQAPSAEFTASLTIVSVGQTIQFTDQSLNSPSSWTWDFGDGSSSALKNPAHSYANPGKFTVSLIVSNLSGTDTKTKAEYITVGNAPNTEFTVSIANPRINQAVTFTDQSTNNPVKWSWDFGDNSTSQAQNPQHVYTATGKYTVSLTATNAFGTSTKSKTDYIDVMPLPPVADFVAEPTTIIEGQRVQFTDRSTNNPTSWGWNFDDASEDTVQNPRHGYGNIGVYTITLSVSNRSGTSSRTRRNYIIVTRKIESENADTIKTGIIDSRDPGFSGSGFLNLDNSQGTYAVWKINLRGGHYNLEIRYANGSINRPMDVYINNVLIVNNLDFPGTGSWSSWRTISIPVDLASGDNYLKMVGDNPESGPNLDTFVLTPVVTK